MRHTITRRQFLKVGGAAVVATAAAGLLSSCGGSSASGSSTGGSGSSYGKRMPVLQNENQYSCDTLSALYIGSGRSVVFFKR